MPLWLRNFIVDIVETGLGVLFALTLFFPSSWEDLKAQGVIVAAAVAGALVSAARRAIPGFLAWLKEKLGTAP
jgi:hypothetical protein